MLHKISKLRDIQQGMYKVIEVQDQGCVNRLIIFVWSPSSLAYEMQKTRSAEYIVNLGMKRSKETGNNYFDFKLA